MDPVCEICHREFLLDQQLPQEIKNVLVLDLIGAAGLDFYDHWDKSYQQNGATTLEVGEDEKYAIAKISLDLLPKFGTVCGDVPNSPFTKEVIAFLRRRGITFVLAIVSQLQPEIASLAVAIANEDHGMKFEDMVSGRGGSLRWDPSRVVGWAVYESE